MKPSAQGRLAAIRHILGLAAVPGPKGPGLDRLEWAMAAAATLMLVWIHGVVFFHAGALWRDEVHMMTKADGSWSEAWKSLAYDSSPALFPLLLRVWTAFFGTGDLAARGLGLAVGLSLLAAPWINGRLIGHRVPFVSLALFGFHLITIRTGDSLRPYGLACALIILAFGLLWRATEKPGAGRLGAAGAAVLLGAHGLYQGIVFLAAACAAAAAISWRRGDRRGVLASPLIVVIAGATLLVYRDMSSGFRDSVLIGRVPLDFAAIARTVWSGALGSPQLWLRFAWLGAAGLGLGLAASAIAGRQTPEPARERLLFAAAAIAAGVAGFFAFSRAVSLPVLARHVMPLLALTAAALDVVFGLACAGRLARIARLATFALLVLLCLPYSLSGARRRQTNVDLIAARLEGLAGPKDLLLVSPWTCGLGFERYYRGQASWTTVPPVADRRLLRVDLIKAFMDSSEPLKEVFQRVDAALAAGGKIWWVTLGTPAKPSGYEPLPPASLSPLGFNEYAYMNDWVFRALAFFASRGLLVEPVEVDAGPVSQMEDLRLSVVYAAKR